MNSPNILWICTDQQRWDTISCLGFKGVRTPNIDRLARTGVAFRNAYTQSPICTPSRASFLTGMYPSAHQVHRNGNAYFPSHLTLLPKVFQDHGWHTGLIGKLHLSASQNRIEKRADDGYDEFYWSHLPFPERSASAEVKAANDYHRWLNEKNIDAETLYPVGAGALYDGPPAELHQTTWATERAETFIRANSDQPWFLSINLFDPHPPFDPPASYLSRALNEVPGPIFADSDLAHNVRFANVDQQTTHPVNPNVKPRSDRDGGIPEGRESHDTPPSAYDAHAIKRAYFAMIELIDDMVGNLLNILEKTGQDRDTLVIFMSDHGEMLTDHGLLYKGCRFYEGLVHVPLLISWPGQTRAGISEALVELIDLPATLLEASGLEPPTQNQGKSLFPLLTGQTDINHHKNRVLCEYWDALRFPGSVGSRGTMYFDGRFKLCLYHDAEQGELFDLRTDPDELNDLWPDPASMTLRQTLTERHFREMMLATGAGPDRIADF